MSDSAKCRRCSECANSSHHWLPNVSYGDEDAPEELQDIEFICKHCEAKGVECIACGGDGLAVDLTDTDNAECLECSGEGVIRSDDV